MPEFRDCPDCGVQPGELHVPGCDVERCPNCGHQMLFDECPEEAASKLARMPWTGEWPDSAQCREIGWYVKLVPGEGWVPCLHDEPGATENLSRLATVGTWNKKTRRFDVSKHQLEQYRRELMDRLKPHGPAR